MRSPRVVLWVLLLAGMAVGAVSWDRQAFAPPVTSWRSVPRPSWSTTRGARRASAWTRSKRKVGANHDGAGATTSMSIAPQDPRQSSFSSFLGQEEPSSADEDVPSSASASASSFLSSFLSGRGAGLQTNDSNAVRPTAATPQPFSLAKAVLCGPFAFESYNDPPRTAGWWQEGTDKNEIAIMDEGFLKEAYGGVLRVRILGLTETRPGGQAVLAKAATRQGKKGSASLIETAVSLEVGEEFAGTQLLQLNKTIVDGQLQGYTAVEGGNEEGSVFSVFVKDPWAHVSGAKRDSKKELRITVKGKDDTALGVAALDLSSLLNGQQKPDKAAAKTWRRDLSLVSSLAAAAGGGEQGEEARQRLAEVALGVRVEVDMQYVRLGGPVPALASPPPPRAPAPSPLDSLKGSTGNDVAASSKEWRGATGCSRDWRELAAALGGDAATAADFELLCFLENKETDTQLKLWRDPVRKRLLVAFRGTEFWKVRDIITDLKLLQEPWDVAGLDREEKEEEEKKVVLSSPSSVEAQAQQEQQQGLDFYAALASQADLTFRLYNDMDKTVKEMFGYVWKKAPFFSASPPPASFQGLSPSLSLSEVDARHHRRQAVEQRQERHQPVAFSAPGLHSSDMNMPSPLYSKWVPPAAPAPAPPAPPAAGAVDESVTNVLMSVLDKVLAKPSWAASSLSSPFFIQPLSGKVRSMADFRQAFYGVASALSHQLLPSSEKEEEEALDFMLDEEEKKEEEEQERSVLDLVGKGTKSPLLMLPSRFKGIFATLVDETLQAMDSKAWGHLPSSSSTVFSTLSSSSRSLRKEAEFRAGLFKALDQVVASLQKKQLEQQASSVAAAAAAAAASLSSSSSSSVLPSLNAESFGVSEEARVHAGFKEAYLSVRHRLMELIESATGGRLEEDGWEVLTTGHSLGGALASLCAHDLSTRFPTSRVSMYNYGAPRLGNTAFAEAYEVANGDSYRLVNENDIFARFPRNVNPAVFNYAHVGKTVLLNNATFWIEGEDCEQCPLMDLQPLRSVPVAAAAAAAAAVNEETKASSTTTLALEPLFLEAEWQLLNAVFSGAALTSHLEFRYLESLLAAHRQQEEEEEEAAVVAESVLLAPPSSPAFGMAPEGMLGKWFKKVPLTVAAAEKERD